MASNLDLKSKWVNDETIMVSWVDVKLRERNAGNQTIFGFVSLGGFIWAIVTGLPNGDFFPLLIWFGAIIALMVWAALKVKEPNSIFIGKNETRHGQIKFNTREITRFEMGSEEAFTGSQITKPMIGNGKVSQTIIRMWVNDTSAYDISRNNWQNQVNHEILTTLTQALKTVRDLDKRQEHEQEFGKVNNETGMPDY